jgi:hypothetical protein
MIFKQKISKEEKFKFGIGMLCGILPCIFILILIIIDGAKVEDIIILSILSLPIILLMLLLGVKELEWYHIFNDHVEVRNIFGIRNSVYYNNVNFIEEVNISLTSKGEFKKTFYVFNDGRKNNHNILKINSCYNKKKYNLRIYKTPELEEFITNHLKIEIKNLK